MNKLLRTHPLVSFMLVGLALSSALAVRAQTATAIRSADFIVAVVNSEPITNAEVQSMRLRLVRELGGRGAQLPPAALLTQ